MFVIGASPFPQSYRLHPTQHLTDSKGSIYPTFFSDRFGRRKPMMFGSFGLFLCMMMISILLSFKGTAVATETAAASVAFFFLFMLIFGASVNCIPWVYAPEILPLHVRAKGYVPILALTDWVPLGGWMC